MLTGIPAGYHIQPEPAFADMIRRYHLFGSKNGAEEADMDSAKYADILRGG